MTADPTDSVQTAASVLAEGRNCWRIARAQRASLLVDGAAYFPAVREAMLQAQRSIFIVGWDVDSRVDLAPDQSAGPDEPPTTLGPLLNHLARLRPGLTIHILLWDYAMFYAAEREMLPGVKLGWATPAQVQLCLDDALPLAASHHQKLVIVDDAVAFCGGLDLTIRRWDTSGHDLDNPDRVDPDGRPYPPFHDMQMLVDGEAARALAELVRERWLRANDRPALDVAPEGDPWPNQVQPDFTDVDIAIARTLPETIDDDPVHEVEALYLDSIAAAEGFIYAENQYLTADSVTQALIDRMRERPDLEAVFVSPEAPGGWFEAHSMGVGRAYLVERLREAGVLDRVRIVHPVVSDGDRRTSVMVHAKAMIVDDRLLRIGSSNLNNRSMGLDSECDLAIEARTDDERTAIAGLRHRLLGEHLGLEAREVAAAEDRAGGLRALLDTAADGTHTLEPVRHKDFEADDLTRTLMSVADPREPLPGSEFAGELARAPRGRFGRPRFWLLAGLIALLAAATATWTLTPATDWLQPERIAEWLDRLNGSVWPYLLLPLAFVVAGITVFPVTLLIAATAIAFGPISGFLLAAGGSLLSAAVTFQIGALLGRRFLRQGLGPRLNRISRTLGEKGVLAVLTLRTAPIAPFTIINLVCGASHVDFRDYILGTAIGMAPGIIAMTAMGGSLRALLLEPSASSWLIVGGAVAFWLALGVTAQVVVSRLRRQQRRG